MIDLIRGRFRKKKRKTKGEKVDLDSALEMTFVERLAKSLDGAVTDSDTTAAAQVRAMATTCNERIQALTSASGILTSRFACDVTAVAGRPSRCDGSNQNRECQRRREAVLFLVVSFCDYLDSLCVCLCEILLQSSS